jgi:hypothetical protein
MLESYTQIHWYEIYYLERRLAELCEQAQRAAHTRTTWDAILEMVRDGVLELVKDDPVTPQLALTDLGWNIAGQIRRHLAGFNMMAEFVAVLPAAPKPADLRYSEKPTADTDVEFWCSMSTNHTAKESETETVEEWTGLTQDEIEEMSHEDVEDSIAQAFDTWMSNFLEYGWT